MHWGPLMNSRNIVTLFFSLSILAGCQSWQIHKIEGMDATAAMPDQSEAGTVQIRYWDGVDGAAVSDLTSLQSYPDTPTSIDNLQELRSTQDRADSYGAMVQGFIVPPTTGDYRFFVSGDDETQFWLSTTDAPADAVLTAMVPRWSYLENYSQYSSQTSAYKTLEAGKRYYFQLLFKEGVGNDHFSVAWEGPGFSQQIVGGNVLYSWANPLYSGNESAEAAYSLGYRVGFTDGSEGLTFSTLYPPLDNDQDGLYDNWEIIMGLDPSNASDANSDPDNDLLSAADEFLLGTREGNQDTDGDGIPDGAEFAYTLNPLDASDAGKDLDGDGATNLDEYLAGTDLDDPTSMPGTSETVTGNAGFIGQYYTGMEFDQFVANRLDGALLFDWAKESPMASLPKDRFSARWFGTFSPPHSSGTRSYRFTITTDDGVRMTVGNSTVINDWYNRSASRSVSEQSFNQNSA